MCVPIGKIRFEHRFWPENPKNILDIWFRFFTVAPPLDKELLHYTYCLSLVHQRTNMITYLQRTWDCLCLVGPADFVDFWRRLLGYQEKTRQVV